MSDTDKHAELLAALYGCTECPSWVHPEVEAILDYLDVLEAALLLAAGEAADLLADERGDFVPAEDLAGACKRIAALSDEERRAHVLIAGGDADCPPRSWMWLAKYGYGQFFLPPEGGPTCRRWTHETDENKAAQAAAAREAGLI